MGEWIAAQQRHLDRSCGALAAPAPKPRIEPSRPAYQLDGFEPRGPGVQGAALGRVERGFGEQSFGEGSDIEAGAANHQR
jgi:hypothetical protein